MEKSTAIVTEHTDMIHDVQPDYYGKNIASCSSDRTVKIFEIQGENTVFVADLKGHEGPVWQVSWAHPKFGCILASCSYDRKVIIWKQASKNQWIILHTYDAHELSVNSVEFGPHEFGLCLACGSSDGTISILSFKDSKWDAYRFPAHAIGVNSISWAPPLLSPSLTKRIVSGGSDKLVKIWKYEETESRWVDEETLSGHNDWVRDVAWAPGIPGNRIASASQDGKVTLWAQEEGRGGRWESKGIAEMKETVWRVSWSVTGSILAVASGEGRVTLWKEGLEGGWKMLGPEVTAGGSQQ